MEDDEGDLVMESGTSFHGSLDGSRGSRGSRGSSKMDMGADMGADTDEDLEGAAADEDLEGAAADTDATATATALQPQNNTYGDATYNECLKQPPKFSIVNFAICFRHLVDSFVGESDCTITDDDSFECFLNNMFDVFGRTDNTFLKIISDVWNNIKAKNIKEIFAGQASLNAIRDSYAPFLNKLALTFKVDREHDLNGKRGTAPNIDQPMDVRKLLKKLGLGFHNNKITAKCFARDTTTGIINKILKDEDCNEQLVYIANLKDTAGTKHLLDDIHYKIGCKSACNSSSSINKNIVEIFILNLCHLFYVSHQSELIYTAAKTQKPFLTPTAPDIFVGTYKSQSDKLTRCIYFKYVLESSKFDYSESKRITIRTTIIQDGVGVTDRSFDCELQDTSLFSVKSVIAFANQSSKVDSFKTCFKNKLKGIGYSEDDANKMFLLFAATNKGAGDFDQVGENVIFNTISDIVLREAGAAGASGASGAAGTADRFYNFIKANGCITATSDTYLYVIALLMECAILLATPLERSVFMSAWSKFQETKLESVHKALVDISIVDESPPVEDCAVSPVDFKPPDTFYEPGGALPVYYLPSTKDTMSQHMLFFATLIFSILHNIGVKGIFNLNEIFNIEAQAVVGGVVEGEEAGAAVEKAGKGEAGKGEGVKGEGVTRKPSTIKTAKEDSKKPFGYTLSDQGFFDYNFYNSFMKYCTTMNQSIKVQKDATWEKYKRYITKLSSDNIVKYATTTSTSSGIERIGEIFDVHDDAAGAAAGAAAAARAAVTVHFPYLLKYVGTIKTSLGIMARMIAQKSMYIQCGSQASEYTLRFRPFKPYYLDKELTKICKKRDELAPEIQLDDKIKGFYPTKIDAVFPKTKEMLMKTDDPSMHLMKTNYDILTLGHFTFLLYNLFEQYINMHLNYLVYEDLHRLLFAIILLREKPADYKVLQFKAVICKELKINFSIPQQMELDGNASASALSQQMQLDDKASSFNFCDTSVIPHSNETSLSLANYLEPNDETICDLCILLLSGVKFLSKIIEDVKAGKDANIFKLEFVSWIDILKRKGDLPPSDKKYVSGNIERANESADNIFNEARTEASGILQSLSGSDKMMADLMKEINKKTMKFHKIFKGYFVDVNDVDDKGKKDKERNNRKSNMKLICAWYNSLIDHIFKQALIPGVKFVEAGTDITPAISSKHLCILDMVDVNGDCTTNPTNSNSTEYDKVVAVIYKTLRSNVHGRGHQYLQTFYSNTSTKAVAHARTTVVFTELHGNIKSHTKDRLLAKIADEYKKKTSSNYESIEELLELFRIDFSTIVENLIKSIILFIFREDYCGDEDTSKQRQFILKLLENYLTLFYHVDTLVDNIIKELNYIIIDLSENILNQIYEDSDAVSSDDVSKIQVMTAKIIETYEGEKEVFEDKLVRVYKKTFSCNKENLRIILKPLFEALKVCDDYLNFILKPTSLVESFRELLSAFDVLKAQIELITTTLRSIKNSFSTEDEKQLIAELVVTHFNEILAVFKLGDMAGKLEKLAQKCKTADQSQSVDPQLPNEQSQSVDQLLPKEQSHPEAHQGTTPDMVPGGGGKLTIKKRKKRKKLAIKGGSLKDVVLNIIGSMRMNKDGMMYDGRQVIRLEGNPSVATAAACFVRMNRMETETRETITELLKTNNINDPENIKVIIEGIYDSSKMCDDEGKESDRIQAIIEEFNSDEKEASIISNSINDILRLDYKYNYNFLGQKLENSKKLCRANFDELTKYNEGGQRSVDNTIFNDKEAFTTEFSDYVGKLPIGVSVKAKFYRGDNKLYKGRIVGYTGEESYMVLFDDDEIKGPYYTNPRYVKLLVLQDDNYVNTDIEYEDSFTEGSLVWAEFYDEKEWYFGKANEWYPGIIVKDNSNDNYSVEFLDINATQITHRQHIKPRDEDRRQEQGAARRGSERAAAQEGPGAMDEDRREGQAVVPMGARRRRKMPKSESAREQEGMDIIPVRKRMGTDPDSPSARLPPPLRGGKLLNKMGLINKATSILAKPKSKPKITKGSLEKQTQKNNEILAKPKSKPKITKASLEKQTQKNNEILAKPKSKPKITKGSLETQTQKDNEILAKPKPKSKITKASLEKQTQKNIFSKTKTSL